MHVRIQKPRPRSAQAPNSYSSSSIRTATVCEFRGTIERKGTPPTCTAQEKAILEAPNRRTKEEESGTQSHKRTENGAVAAKVDEFCRTNLRSTRTTQQKGNQRQGRGMEGEISGRSLVPAMRSESASEAACRIEVSTRRRTASSQRGSEGLCMVGNGVLCEGGWSVWGAKSSPLPPLSDETGSFGYSTTF